MSQYPVPCRILQTLLLAHQTSRCYPVIEVINMQTLTRHQRDAIMWAIILATQVSKDKGDTKWLEAWSEIRWILEEGGCQDE